MTESIDELIAGLGSPQPVERQCCRYQLVESGAASVPALTALLKSEDDRLRWEAVKALAAIADPSSIPDLVQALEDDDRGVRWDAAVALVNIGQPSVTPVLQAIIDRSHASVILEGAQHVIHDLAHTDWGDFLVPVYEAFNSSESTVSAPVAAQKALEKWRRTLQEQD